MFPKKDEEVALLQRYHDEDTAEAKTEVERATWLCKHARALTYEGVEGKSVEDRKMAVERSGAVVQAEERRISAILGFEKLKAKRETEALIVEVWRSLNANRRQAT